MLCFNHVDLDGADGNGDELVEGEQNGRPKEEVVEKRLLKTQINRAEIEEDNA